MFNKKSNGGDEQNISINMRTTLYPVVSEKDMQDYHKETQDMIEANSIRYKTIHSLLESEIKSHSSKGGSKGNFLMSKNLHLMILDKVTFHIYFYQRENYFDSMIEKNISVLNGKSTLKEARELLKDKPTPYAFAKAYVINEKTDGEFEKAYPTIFTEYKSVLKDYLKEIDRNWESYLKH